MGQNFKVARSYYPLGLSELHNYSCCQAWALPRTSTHVSIQPSWVNMVAKYFAHKILPESLQNEKANIGARPVGITTLVDSPGVGRNLIDHTLTFTSWKLKHPEENLVIGSSNPLFSEIRYTWGAPADFIATTGVSKEGLAAAIEVDEGTRPDLTTHALLKQERPFLEYFFLHAGAPDGSAVMLAMVDLHQTSRGTVRLDPADLRGTPLIDPNYLSTEVDKYVHRELFRTAAEFAVSKATIIGREVVDSELAPPGMEPLTVDASDEFIDKRIRDSIR
jgi:choline dehydrogenase-like flavoprotein